MKKLVLIDGHNIAYRAYFALPTTMKTGAGITTNALYGFTSILMNIIQSEQPDYMAVAFDSREATFRHEMYDNYKAHRPKPDEALIEQLPLIIDIVKTFSLPVIKKPGYEADDLIGTLAAQACREGVRTIIVTGDRDCLQLVNDCVSVMSTRKGISETIYYTPERVREQYSLNPTQIIDLKSLQGDPSDNIPGVPGIGEKTAIKLLNQFGSLENILRDIDAVAPSGLQEKLREHVGQARLSYELARIDTNVPFDISFKELALDIDWNRVRDVFLEYQFNSLLKRIPEEAQPVEPASEQMKTRFHIIRDFARLQNVQQMLKECGSFSFDVETTSVDPMEAEIVGISFCCRSGEAHYIPWPSVPALPKQQQTLFSLVQPQATDKGSDLTREEFTRVLRDIFSDPNQEKIAHNSKYDLIILNRLGIEVKGRLFDTMIADYLIEPTRTYHNLKYLAQFYFNTTMTPIKDLIGTGRKQTTMDQVEVERVAEYCCADADMVFRLKQVLARLLREKNLCELYDTLEEPLIRVLMNMELQGVSLDTAYLATLSTELAALIREEEKHIYLLAGGQFNINSPQQLGDVLFNRLGIPPLKKTKTGPSTDNSVLEALASRYEIASRITTYRQLAKLKNTYIDALPRLINKETGHLHTTFNQTVTATGRLSSTNPNLQNIPIKTELGRKIRAAFIPSSEDRCIITADYSQMELRILAELSGDGLLKQAFLTGRDVHTSTAAILFEVPEQQVTGDMRRKAKTINFGIIYGMSAKGLSDSLQISFAEARRFIDSYFAKYTGIRQFIDELVEQAKRDGYVRTHYGRIREVPDITASNFQRREAARRIAINAPIQGTASDIMKQKMIEIHTAIQSLPYYCAMLIQVHDELVFEVAGGHRDEFTDLLQKIMPVVEDFSIPFPISVATGANWQEAK